MRDHKEALLLVTTTVIGGKLAVSRPGSQHRTVIYIRNEIKRSKRFGRQHYYFFLHAQSGRNKISKRARKNNNAIARATTVSFVNPKASTNLSTGT